MNKFLTILLILLFNNLSIFSQEINSKSSLVNDNLSIKYEEQGNNIILYRNEFEKILVPGWTLDIYLKSNLTDLKFLRLEKLKFPEGSSIKYINNIPLESRKDISKAYKIFKNDNSFKIGISINGEVKNYTITLIDDSKITNIEEKEVASNSFHKNKTPEKEEINVISRRKYDKHETKKHPEGMVVPIDPQIGKPYSVKEMIEFQNLSEILPKNSLIPKYLTPDEFEEQDKKNSLIKEYEIKRNTKSITKEELETYYKHQLK
ncbi:MAG: hypothetical protein KDK36_04365, partial [Leptospiraceae bacterium]|nr:hypothetical protein [Leptospiraceae bacterium]